MEALKRCKICHLPETYPGLTIAEDGVCSLCRREKPAAKPYLGLPALREKVARVLAQPQYADRPYDVAVAFSGGRDSSYLLYYAKHVLGLSVLAVTLMHDYMPLETADAIANICASMGVDWKVIPNQALNDGSAQCVQAWARKPEAATLVSFCTGCRYGIKRLIPDYCRKNGIPLLLVGNTRMEQMSYRQDLLALDPQHPTTLNKAIGYLRSLARNPGMLGTPGTACVQVYEFGYPLARKVLKDRKLTVLAPFRDYVEVTEAERTATLQSIGWQHNANFKSEWRADCYVNILRQYFYQRMLGFNDLDVHYADLLRDGQITLPAALERLNADNTFDDAVIADILREHYKLDLQAILDKLPTR